MEKQFEKIPLEIYENSRLAFKAVAKEISKEIKSKAAKGKNCVLGLATGSSPVSVYNELVRLHKEEDLSFANVVSFNLDEYYPMPKDSLQSYFRFMHEHFFDHVDIKKENVFIPDGTIEEGKVSEYCDWYEEKIAENGGIDLQILGIGRTGHIGFNEPGSSINSPTRLITLDYLTITDAASDFFGEENVPRRAITMGVGTILKSKRIILMAWGEGKAEIIRETVEGKVSDTIPATYLQNFKDAKIFLDLASADSLTRIATPWLVKQCDWNSKLIRKAVTWLCGKVNKPILKLTDRDYNEYGMADLITKYGPAYNINIKVFNDLQHTITGWPGGKPNTDDSSRQERAKPFPKRVLVFSPHPDDDVISMGGTLLRLVQQNHIVNVAYQTSGNIAVFDDDVLRYLDFINEMDETYFPKKLADDKKFYEKIISSIKNKKPGEKDADELLEMKGMIRRGEAKSACRYIGISPEKIHFLEMPFYETGTVRKKPLSNEDIKILVDLMRKIEPHQIYLAGDLSDPHGTHRVCYEAIDKALQVVKNDKWFSDCYIWMYRGAWQEWDISRVEMAVPLSPQELSQKRKAIFKHQSQKDKALFPGFDSREFWQRAEDRNRKTAELYDKLGMAEYEAMELFVKYQQEK
ncbi:MAG: glucosamine-6-phosphate deaminase [Bacteroidales bacterium]|nr:glucosamine-6-phosphate deaminase [Bacteroidales bacterium]